MPLYNGIVDSHVNGLSFHFIVSFPRNSSTAEDATPRRRKKRRERIGNEDRTRARNANEGKLVLRINLFPK